MKPQIKAIIVFVLLMPLNIQAQHHHHSDHHEGGSVQIGMEQESIAYLNASHIKRKHKKPALPFTIEALTGDASLNEHDVMLVPFAGEVKFVAVGQIVAVLNHLEAEAQEEGGSLKTCKSKDLLKLFIENRKIQNSWTKPDCYRRNL